MWKRSPSRLSSMCRTPHLHYVQTLLDSTKRVTSRDITRAVPFSIHIWPILRGRVPFNPRLPELNRTVVSLKISSNLTNAEKVDNETLERAMHQRRQSDIQQRR